MPAPDLPKNNVTLEKVIGLTSLSNAAFSVNSGTGEVAYAAGSVVVVYSARRNRQVRFFRASKTVSCCCFSSDGKFLAIGETGHAPAVIVWDLSTGAVKSELKGHKFGVSALAFSPSASTLVSTGFKHDRRLYIWNWRASRPVAAARISQKVYSICFTSSKQFVTAGANHLKFWNMDTSNVIFPDSPNPNDLTSSISADASVLAAHLPNPETALPEIKGYPASILASHANSTFVDVAHHGPTDKVYTVTSNGTLCAFSASSLLMENWVSLESPRGCR